MYNHNKAQQRKNRVHISWDILYVFLGNSPSELFTHGHRNTATSILLHFVYAEFIFVINNGSTHVHVHNDANASCLRLNVGQ